MNKRDTSTGESAAVEFKLAELWRQKGKPKRVAEGLRRAIRVEPGYLPAYLELISLLVEHQDYAQAIEVCLQAIQCNPGERSLEGKLIQLRKLEQHLESIAGPSEQEREINQSSSGKPCRLLLYTDGKDFNGVGQCNHVLMSAMNAAGYVVSCAQGRAHHHLIALQQSLGIIHHWLAQDDLHDEKRTPLAFSNEDEPRSIFDAARPDLVIFSSGSPFSSLAAKEIAAESGIPFLIIVHCVAAHMVQQFAAYMGRLEGVHSSARAIVAVSHDNLELLHQHFGLPESAGQVIRNGITDKFFVPVLKQNKQRMRQELGLSDDAIVVLTVARLGRSKGYQFLVKAVAMLRQRPVWPRLRFVWAGSGSYESRLRAVAIELEVADQIIFLGDRTDIPDLLDMSDMFVLTSLYEGMPLSIMEAMAKSLPVIASAVSGVPEQMGNTGKLLPAPGVDAQATITEAASVIEALALDLNLRKRMGRAARQRAEQLFRAAPMIDTWIDFLERVVTEQ